MLRTVLWIVLAACGLVVLALLVRWAIALGRWIDRLLLKAEENGWIYYRNKSSGGSASNMMGAAMSEIDRVVRPSAEYRIEAEQQIVEDDEQGGQ